jgi:uncharacterized protein YjhX (UPF0386 family)
MIKLYILIGLFFCLKAFAGYECNFDLAHTEDLRSSIANKTITASSKDMRSQMIRDFFIELEKGNKVRSIALNIFVDGWEGEEEITLAVFRRLQKKSDVQLDLISQKVSLRGNAKDTLWFDAYKLEIDCSII